MLSEKTKFGDEIWERIKDVRRWVVFPHEKLVSVVKEFRAANPDKAKGKTTEELEELAVPVSKRLPVEFLLHFKGLLERGSLALYHNYRKEIEKSGGFRNWKVPKYWRPAIQVFHSHHGPSKYRWISASPRLDWGAIEERMRNKPNDSVLLHPTEDKTFVPNRTNKGGDRLFLYPNFPSLPVSFVKDMNRDEADEDIIDVAVKKFGSDGTINEFDEFYARMASLNIKIPSEHALFRRKAILHYRTSLATPGQNISKTKPKGILKPKQVKKAKAVRRTKVTRSVSFDSSSDQFFTVSESDHSDSSIGEPLSKIEQEKFIQDMLAFDAALDCPLGLSSYSSRSCNLESGRWIDEFGNIILVASTRDPNGHNYCFTETTSSEAMGFYFVGLGPMDDLEDENDTKFPAGNFTTFDFNAVGDDFQRFLDEYGEAEIQRSIRAELGKHTDISAYIFAHESCLHIYIKQRGNHVVKGRLLFKPKRDELGKVTVKTRIVLGWHLVVHSNESEYSRFPGLRPAGSQPTTADSLLCLVKGISRNLVPSSPDEDGAFLYIPWSL
jgi:hypothetical protein